MSVNIDVNKLELVFAAILSHLQGGRGLSEIVIEKDMYWNVPAEDICNLSEEPKLDIGSVRDDYMDLTRIALGEQPPLAVHLVTLGNVLRIIGETISDHLAEEGG